MAYKGSAIPGAPDGYEETLEVCEGSKISRAPEGYQETVPGAPEGYQGSAIPGAPEGYQGSTIPGAPEGYQSSAIPGEPDGYQPSDLPPKKAYIPSQYRADSSSSQDAVGTPIPTLIRTQRANSRDGHTLSSGLDFEPSDAAEDNSQQYPDSTQDSTQDSNQGLDENSSSSGPQDEDPAAILPKKRLRKSRFDNPDDSPSDTPRRSSRLKSLELKVRKFEIFVVYTC